MSKVIELTQGKVALVDDEDYERINAIRWYYDKGNDEAGATVGGRLNKRHIKMHRVVMNAPDGMEVDHKNHNRLDNRKENLRLATRAENARNKLKNTLLGVSMWRAQVAYRKKVIPVGSFKTQEEAHLAREAFKEELIRNNQ